MSRVDFFLAHSVATLYKRGSSLMFSIPYSKVSRQRHKENATLRNGVTRRKHTKIKSQCRTSQGATSKIKGILYVYPHVTFDVIYILYIIYYCFYYIYIKITVSHFACDIAVTL